MPARRPEIKVVVEFADSEPTVDAESVADLFAIDLQTDAVTRWAEEVQAAIADAQCVSLKLGTPRDDKRERDKDAIEAQIAALQRQLGELDQPSASKPSERRKRIG